MKKTLLITTITISLFLSFFGLGFNKINNNQNYNNQVNSKQEKLDYQNSISSQEFIDDLENLQPGDEYVLNSNVDFSNSINDDVKNIELTDITIEGNGYTLYNRNIVDLFETTTFVPDSTLGFANYSFFKTMNNVTINNLNFDNFMFPMGNIYNSTFNNVNFFDTSYENLVFNFSNLSTSYINSQGVPNLSLATIGLSTQIFSNSNWNYSYFENISFSNNEIILGGNNSYTISLIGVVEDNNSFETHNSSFSNFYINNISFENNYLSSSSQDAKYNNDNELYSIFYNPFIGSTTDSKDTGTFLSLNLNSIIFNNINIYGNQNNFLNYTFYNLIPAISPNVILTGTNIYGFNLNVDTTTDVSNNKKIATGNLTQLTNYTNPSEGSLYFKKTGIYQSNWITENVYSETIPINIFATYESIINSINKDFYYDQNNNSLEEGFNKKYWYFDKLSVEQDLSLTYVEKPSIIDLNIDQYDQNEILNFSFYFSDGYINSSDLYNLELYDLNSGKIFKSWSLKSGDLVNDSISTSDLFYGGNDIHLKISNSNNYWDQKINVENIVPRVYNVSNSISEQGNVIVSFSTYDPFLLLESINVTLYKDDSILEQKNLSFNSIETKEENLIEFETIIDTNNLDSYLIGFDVEYNIGILKSKNFYKTNVKMKQNLIDYSNDYDIKFGFPIESFPAWAIVLITLIILLILIILILFIYLLLKSNKKTKEISNIYEEKIKEYGIQLFEENDQN